MGKWFGREEEGPGCQCVEQQVPGGLGLSWNCHLVRNGGLGFRRGPQTLEERVMIPERQGLLRGPGDAEKRS